MSICINSLEIILTQRDADSILAKGFQYSTQLNHPQPQQFEFKAFISKAELTDSFCDSELNGIWVNWINRNKLNATNETLVIEFETEGPPPLAIIDSFISWMKTNYFVFQLKYNYRLENQKQCGSLESNNGMDN